MKLVFNTDDDKMKFVELVEESGTEVTVDGKPFSAEVMKDVALCEDVDVEVDNIHSTMGIELVSDFITAGLLKEGEDVGVSSNWIG